MLGSKRLQVRAIQSLLSTVAAILANAEYNLLRYYSSRRTLEFLDTMHGLPLQLVMVVLSKLDFITASARELKGAVCRVVEVEWVKLTRFFLRDRAVKKKKAPHLNI